jgi:selenocysteine-specific elongation factor
VAPALRVVATAGHVDHGKSSLIVALTGIDPDRFVEEKRRGLTIDLGYAWCDLPSGRDVGFVDVPGHERFVHNMLAGVGPVRLVLFVVAADEGWKPQSEEHLQILDVLGVTGAVIALTKVDLVDPELAALAEDDVLEHVAGTALEGAPIVPVSSRTGEGVEALRAALDTMLVAAPPPPVGRARLFIDRVFSITGAGTVITGTLEGTALEVGEEIELVPGERRARIRSLQTHKQAETRAEPVSRVAANLVGVEREDVGRGDVLGHAGTWRPTDTVEVELRPVRGLARAVTSRGAFHLHAGAAEVETRVRLLDGPRLEPGGRAFARLRLARPLVLDVGDRFVLREAGRRATVAGGTVLDVAPPARPGANAALRLAARAAASREQLPDLLATERGAVRADEAALLTGVEVRPNLGAWLIDDGVRDAAVHALVTALHAFHRNDPLGEGMAPASARRVVSQAIRAGRGPRDEDLTEAVIQAAVAEGTVERSGGLLRVPGHRPGLGARGADVERLLRVLGAAEPTPPTLKELADDGLDRQIVEAAAREGLVVRVPPDLVFTPDFVDRAQAVVRGAGASGISVGAFREALGTSRKFAVPLLEWFDQRGITRREGDLRFARGA